MKILWAKNQANVWCLFHFGDCVLTHGFSKSNGKYVTTRVEVGAGSIMKANWKTHKIFYP